MATRQAVMRRYLDRVVAGDLVGAASFYTDDILFHWAGNGPMSGTYKGKEAYFAALTKLRNITDSVSVEEHDLLTSEDHAVVLNRGTYVRGGKSITTNRVVVYHFSGDKISEVWVVDESQRAVDELLS